MLTIYEIDELGQWTGAAREIDNHEGWDVSWTLAPEPPDFEGVQCAVWASGVWHLRDRINPVAGLASTGESPPEPT